MDAKIAKATQGLTTAAHMRDTTQLLMQPDVNWETFLTPAPLSIAIMVELVFLSSVTDFSINKNAPADGYKYIQHPGSFTACIMQVCNSGWQAFNTAHKNMNQICILTGGVPRQAKIAVKLLFTGKDEDSKDLLPSLFKNLAHTVNESVTLAQVVVQNYSNVILLIQELLEACVNAERFYGEELERIQSKIEQNKLREKAARELKETLEKVLKLRSQQLEKAEEIYRKAMDSVPPEWEESAMDVLDGFIGSFATNPKQAIQNLMDANLSKNQTHVQNPQQNNGDEMVSKIMACGNSKAIRTLATLLREFINDDDINWAGLYDQKRKELKTIWAKYLFNEIFEKLNNLSKSMIRDSASSLVERGITVCEKLDGYKPDRGWSKAQTADVIKTTTELYTEAVRFNIRCGVILGSPSLRPKPPMMYKVESSKHLQTASKTSLESARLLAAQSEEQLRKVKRAYGKTVRNMEESFKNLTAIANEMQITNVTNFSFDIPIKMLGKGMEAMSRVKEQWEKMVQLLQVMASTANTSLGTGFDSIPAGADHTMNTPYNAKLFAKDVIYHQVFQTSNVASLVHVISKTYYEVSDLYLMNSVSRLSALMTMDKSSNDFLPVRQMVHEFCKEAQEGILRLVRTKEREFESKLDARIAQIGKVLKAVLPAASPQENKRIEAIVQAGFAEAGSDNI